MKYFGNFSWNLASVCVPGVLKCAIVPKYCWCSLVALRDRQTPVVELWHIYNFCWFWIRNWNIFTGGLNFFLGKGIFLVSTYILFNCSSLLFWRFENEQKARELAAQFIEKLMDAQPQGGDELHSCSIHKIEKNSSKSKILVALRFQLFCKFLQFQELFLREMCGIFASAGCLALHRIWAPVVSQVDPTNPKFESVFIAAHSLELRIFWRYANINFALWRHFLELSFNCARFWKKANSNCVGLTVSTMNEWSCHRLGDDDSDTTVTVTCCQSCLFCCKKKGDSISNRGSRGGRTLQTGRVLLIHNEFVFNESVQSEHTKWCTGVTNTKKFQAALHAKVWNSLASGWLFWQEGQLQSGRPSLYWICSGVGSLPETPPSLPTGVNKKHSLEDFWITILHRTKKIRLSNQHFLTRIMGPLWSKQQRKVGSENPMD